METISLKDLQADVETALGLWHEPNAAGSPLAYLSCVRLAMSNPLLTRRAHNQVLLNALDALAMSKPQSAQLLRLRFLEKLQVAEVALHLNIVENTYYVRKPIALRHLAEAVFELEQTHRIHRTTLLEQRLLPPTYEVLVGADDGISEVIDHLSRPTAPWLVSLEGLGGIGKTAVADKVVRHVLQAGTFGDVGWVSAQSEQFSLRGTIRVAPPGVRTVPALIEALFHQLSEDVGVAHQPLSTEEMVVRLQQRLKTIPHLIVIDNLETFEEVEPLLPVLRRLMNPSKFLLTSRHTLVGEADVFHVPVRELSETDAIGLIRHEARTRNLSVIATSDASRLRPLFQVAGGNPLALRLLIGQLQVFDVDVVVANLAQARGSGVEALYTYIYWKAWEQLDEGARRVFLTLPLFPHQGGTLKRMEALTRLEPVQVEAAVHQLVQFNLVDARGDIDTRKYTIHSLTRSFLQEQVARWQ